MKPSVFLTCRLPDAVMDRLSAETNFTFNAEPRTLTRAELIAGARECDALLPVINDHVDDEVMAAAPRLRVIANFGVGYNNIDVAAATARRIPVTNTPGVLTDATADIAFGLLLAAARRFSEGDHFVRSREWPGWEPLQLLGCDVYGAVLGIVGLGRIGQAVARRARGFRMQVLYWDVARLSHADESELGVEYRDRDALLSESDFISLHVAYNPSTHHLIDEAAFSRMKPTAVLVNTARGAVVDEKALVRALQTRKLAAAGLDVYENEPRLEPELYELPNCILLPHLGSATIGTRTRMGMMAVDNLLAACAGRRPPNCVNPEVLG